MITNVWKDVGYTMYPPESIDVLGITRARNFAGYHKEQLYSDAFLALVPGGSLYVVADAEWSTPVLISEVEEFGFEYRGPFDQDTHKSLFGYGADYKIQGHLFAKTHPASAREYAMEYYRDVPDGATVLDVGPGNYPLPMATNYLETPDRKNHPEYAEKWLPNPERIIWGNIDDPQLWEGKPWKHYDFIWASHVLEHVEDPETAAHNMSLMGKRGVMICPGHLKEALFLWEEADHKWDVFAPSQPGGPVRFVRRNEALRKKLLDPAAAGALCRIFRTGPPRTHDHRTLAAWYRKVEPSLDVIVPWTDRLEVEVLR